MGCLRGHAGRAAARRAARLGTARALIAAALGSGLSDLLIPASGAGARAVLFVIGLAGSGAGSVTGNIIAASFRQTYCPPTTLGRAVTSMRFLSFGGIPLGALAAGALTTALGVRSALWIVLGIGALSGTLLLTPAIRSRKNLPTEPGA
jgi:hypothetical protein